MKEPSRRWTVGKHVVDLLLSDLPSGVQPAELDSPTVHFKPGTPSPESPPALEEQRHEANERGNRPCNIQNPGSSGQQDKVQGKARSSAAKAVAPSWVNATSFQFSLSSEFGLPGLSPGKPNSEEREVFILGVRPRATLVPRLPWAHSAGRIPWGARLSARVSGINSALRFGRRRPHPLANLRICQGLAKAHHWLRRAKKAVTAGEGLPYIAAAMMLNHRRYLACLLALVCFGSCSRQETPSGQKKLTIAVIPKGATHNFWKSIHAGALMAASELGNIDILWKSGLKENDRDAEIQVVEDMTTRKVDGLVLAPLDDVALRPPVNEAVQRGIPVVIIDSDLKTDKYTSFVATDNYLGGTRGAQRLAALLQDKGRVVMLRCMEGSASTMAREQGFLDEMKKHPGIQVLSSNQYGGATTEEAYKASENMLAPFRKADGSLNLDGIFSSNESTTFGMLRALQDSQWAGKVRFVGFDSSAALVKALENKELNGLVLQDPIKMGYLGVKTVVAHLHGEKVARRIDTGSTVATPENCNDPAIRKVLEPDFKKWLKEE